MISPPICLARLVALAMPLFLAGITASAEPVETGIPGAFGFFTAPPSKEQELARINRQMRRAGCSRDTRQGDCAQFSARARALSSALGLIRPAPKPRRAPMSRVDSAGATYRTVCVRMCDGFYFPISEASNIAHFAADQARCNSACSAPTKLFYMPNADAGPEQMIALSGERYTSLPNAFRYRSEYDVTCSCKPLPWSAAGKAAFDRRAVLAGRNQLAQRVAAGAGEAAKLLAESPEAVVQTSPPPRPRRNYASRPVIVGEAQVSGGFRLFRPSPNLLGPASSRKTEAPRRRFFIFGRQ